MRLSLPVTAGLRATWDAPRVHSGRHASTAYQRIGETVGEEQVTFHNKPEIRVQAQMFTGRILVSTCLADPGESHTLQSSSVRYDIYLKNAATGWEITRKRDNAAATVTLCKH